MRLLLIRHGETPSNLYGALDTKVPGPALTERGAQQSAAIPDALAAEDIGAMFVSPLTRARLTAAPLAKRLDLPVTIRDGLREIGAGDLEMNHDSESLRTYYTTGFAWSSGWLEEQIPGGESGVGLRTLRRGYR
jgi:broad specificity phosphatase PhoE